MVNRRDFNLMLAMATGVPAAARSEDAQGPALKGAFNYFRLGSRNVPGDVEIAVYTPPGYSRSPARPYPLMLFLHGGNGSARDLSRFAPMIERAMAEGRLPPMVIATPSARRSLYMDYRDGSERWESFILADLLPHLRRTLAVSSKRSDTYIGGISMGGLGSLRIAFKHPDLFAAVAALEPAIEPALAWSEVGPHVKFWRPDAVVEALFGRPVDPAYWAANNPATIAKKDPDRLLDLAIYLDVGDQDMLYLTYGVEYLHRILFDAGIAHEYRMVHGGEHVGPSVYPRVLDGLGFIGRQIDPPLWVDESVRKARAIFDDMKHKAGLPVEAPDPRRLRPL